MPPLPIQSAPAISKLQFDRQRIPRLTVVAFSPASHNLQNFALQGDLN